MDGIGEKLLGFIRKEFPDGAGVNMDDPLLQGVVDSLGIFTIVGFIENNFGVTFEDRDLTSENFASVRTLAGLVAAKKSP